MIKKLLFSAAACALVFSATAQTNAGFEAWGSSLGEPEEPTGWITANIFASPFVSSSNPTSAYKLTSPNNLYGNYSLKLKTVKLVANPDTTTIPDTLGLAMEGTVTLTPSFKIIDRIPFTSRPAVIHFSYKYMPNGVDTGWCYIELTKWNNNLMRRDTIGNLAIWVNSLQNNWTPISGSLLYYPNHPNLMPDSMALAFSSSSGYTPKLNSEMWLDDIFFSGWTGVNELNGNATHLTAYPNPTKDQITISADLDNAYTVVLYDAIGRTIGKYTMNDRKYIFNTSDWRAGNYYYSILDKEGAVLAGNTFSVIK